MKITITIAELFLLLVRIIKSKGNLLRRNLNDEEFSRTPVMHTYIHSINNSSSSSALFSQKSTKLWEQSWKNAGFDIRILTEEDARKHSKFEFLKDQLTLARIPKSLWDHYFKYLAMSLVENGGWYSDRTILPLQFNLNFGNTLPNGGAFTMHDGTAPDLQSGSQQEWIRITSSIVLYDLQRLKNGEALSIQLQLREYNEFTTNHMRVLAVSTHILDSNWNSILKCPYLNDKIAIKISLVENLLFQNYVSTIFRALEDCTDSKYGLFSEDSSVASSSSSSSSSRPIIYTFFELAFLNPKVEEKLLSEVHSWKAAWETAGFKAVVLTLEDAKKHALYNKLKYILDSNEFQLTRYDKMCYYRWLAVAYSAKKGAWMSDLDVYPLQMLRSDYSNYVISNEEFPYKGKLTGYCWKTPCLVSGSKEHWNHYVSLMYESILKHPTVFWSDMLAFQEIEKQISSQIGYRNEYISIQHVYTPVNMDVDKSIIPTKPFELKEFCYITKDRIAVHFSHNGCSEVIFCDTDRGSALHQWIQAWREQCLDYDSTNNKNDVLQVAR